MPENANIHGGSIVIPGIQIEFSAYTASKKILSKRRAL
jgi:hypothetical protein